MEVVSRKEVARADACKLLASFIRRQEVELQQSGDSSSAQNNVEALGAERLAQDSLSSLRRVHTFLMRREQPSGMTSTVGATNEQMLSDDEQF
ncbi:MAG: hypothetical protein MHM6MM_005488 [Cercozoa sp. M6MM]